MTVTSDGHSPTEKYVRFGVMAVGFVVPYIGEQGDVFALQAQLGCQHITHYT